MEDAELKRALKLQKEAEKVKKDKEPDIFDVVKKRKRDIDARQATVDKRKKRQRLREERLKDPVNRGLAENLDGKVARRARSSASRHTRIVDSTSGTYRCPGCKQVILEESRWVIGKEICCCKSCWVLWRGDFRRMTKADFSNIKLYKGIIKLYPVDAGHLCRMRKQLGISIQLFSKLVGWLPSYQYRLESGTIQFISEKNMEEICETFRRKDFPIKPDVWGDTIERYIPAGDTIRQIRELRKISRGEFCARTGWSVQYQSRIETGSVKSLSKEAMELIHNSLNRSV